MTARDTVLIALFAALTSALGLLPPIPVPLIPVPVTAQTFGVMLAGCLIGSRRAGLAMLLLLALLAMGLPLLSGGRGGLAVFVGPSAGFLIGWPVGAWLIGFISTRYSPSTAALFAANCIGGIGAVYALGIPVMAIALDVPFITAALGSAMFLPGDIVKAAAAAAVAARVRRAYPMSNS
jgi:biotin transport system substrate-specific component